MRTEPCGVRQVFDRCSIDVRSMFDRCSMCCSIDLSCLNHNSMLDRCSIDVRSMLDRCSKDVRFCMTCELSFALPTNLNSWISALMGFCMSTVACLGLSAFPSVFISVGIRPHSCGSVYQHLRGPSESVEVNRLESVGGIRAGIAKR